MTEKLDATLLRLSASPLPAATDLPVEDTFDDASKVRLYLAAMTAFFSGPSGDGHREVRAQKQRR
jgi:hypothetical protein